MSNKSASQRIARVSFAIFIATFQSAAWLKGDDAIDNYCNAADNEFDSLMQKCPDDRVSFWQQQRSAALQKYLDKAKELQDTEAALKKEPDWERYRPVFAYSYVNAVNDV